MHTECIFWKTIALSMEENGYICTLFQIENRAVVMSGGVFVRSRPQYGLL